MRELNIGLLQLPASNQLERSLRALDHFSKRIKEADLVIMPEYAMIDPTNLSSEDLLKIAEDIDNPGIWLRSLIRLAKEKGVCLVGTLFRKGYSKPRNTVVLINNMGEILSYYDKTHLFDAFGYKESEKFEAGNSLFEPKRLCNVNIGLAVCFELRFPEVFRYEALRGAELVAVPAAWYRGPLKEAMLDFLSRSRAHENTIFLTVVALSEGAFTGGSMIVDPLGFTIANAGPSSNYLEINIDLDRLKEVRKSLPLLELRREELYQKIKVP